MSYSIILENKHELIKEIPFSTNKTYEEYWLPLIEKFNLTLLEYFQYGYEIMGKSEDLPNLILEFEKINNEVNNENKNLRLNFIITELKQIKPEKFISIYIG